PRPCRSPIRPLRPLPPRRSSDLGRAVWPHAHAGAGRMVTWDLPGGEPSRPGDPDPGPDSDREGERELIRVGIADDHPLIRQAVTTLLSMEPDIEVVGEADDAQGALELVHRHQPD